MHRTSREVGKSLLGSIKKPFETQGFDVKR